MFLSPSFWSINVLPMAETQWMREQENLSNCQAFLTVFWCWRIPLWHIHGVLPIMWKIPRFIIPLPINFRRAPSTWTIEQPPLLSGLALQAHGPLNSRHSSQNCSHARTGSLTCLHAAGNLAQCYHRVVNIVLAPENHTTQFYLTFLLRVSPLEICSVVLGVL